MTAHFKTAPLKPCATCAHWQPVGERSAAYLAACAVAQRRTQFDETCPDFRPLPIGPPGQPPGGLVRCGGALPDPVQTCEPDPLELIITIGPLPDLRAAGEAMSRALRLFNEALARAGGPLKQATHQKGPDDAEAHS